MYREAEVGVSGVIKRENAEAWEAKPGGDERRAADEVRAGLVPVAGHAEAAVAPPEGG
jgi:hypothetical protein